MAILSNNPGAVQPDVTPKSLKYVPSTFKKNPNKVGGILNMKKSSEVVGRRSGLTKIMPNTENASMLPKTSVSVQKGSYEAHPKVDTMRERNNFASPTSNPAGAPPHLQRTAHPVNPIIGRKKIKFQQGGILTKSITPWTPAQRDSVMNSPDWKKREHDSGRMEQPPIDPIDFVGLVPEVVGTVTARTAAKLAATKALPRFFEGTTINLTHPRTVRAATKQLGIYNHNLGRLLGTLTTSGIDAAGN